MKYEYQVMILDGTRTRVRDTLNGLGQDRWELVGVAGSTAYFKRAIPEYLPGLVAASEPKRLRK